MPIICVSFAECVDCLTLLAIRSARPSSLLMFITLSLVMSTLLACADCFTLLERRLKQSQTLCWRSSPSNWWRLRSCTPHLFSHLIYDGEHLDLLIYCRICKQSHTLGKTFGKAKLSVDVSGHVTLLTYLTYIFTAHLWWWTFRFYPFCLCPMLSSLFLAFAEYADCLTLLGRCSAKSSFFWSSSPPSW